MNKEEKEKLLNRLNGLAEMLIKENRKLFACDIYDAVNIIKEQEEYIEKVKESFSQ